MFLKTVALLVFVIVIFLAYVSTRESKFRYERSGVIQAPPEAVFPYLSHLTKGQLWVPFEKTDANLKRTFHGEDGTVGSKEEFEGNREAGAGEIEVVKMQVNEFVELKLTMLKPFRAENQVEYRLTPEANGTRFTWSMSGDGGFMGKLISVFIDCEKMVADQFTVGIENLKKIVESEHPSGSR